MTITREDKTNSYLNSYKDSGKKYIDNGNFYEAIDCYKNAIKLKGDDYDSWFYIAYALKENQQIDDAIFAYKRAIELNPQAINAYRNLGNIYYFVKNDPNSAIGYYKKILEYDADNLRAKGCLALSYTKTKNYEEAWKYFDYRISNEICVLARALIPNSLVLSRPLWRGEKIKDKVLYVYYEAGFGDTIMFARYLTMLKDKCAKVLFSPQMAGTELFNESDLGIEIMDPKTCNNQFDFDVHIPIMSLPSALKLNSEKDIPLTDKYLKTNPEKVKTYKEKYFAGNTLKIGIKWQGNTRYDQTRSIMLKSFYKLFDIPNTKFYSLQKGDGIEQLEDTEGHEIVDLGATFNDFSYTAAAIENLDLVICNDTSVAHLAGALGKPCWTLLPFIQDWRWSTDISYCIWYKSLKLFKQIEPDNWDEVFVRVYKELAGKVKSEMGKRK